MEFEWDESKAAANLSKHDVSFNEAKTVFQDTLYIIFDDPNHSNFEQRYIIIGESAQKRILMVAFTERDSITRLISARKATRKEREDYEEG